MKKIYLLLSTIAFVFCTSLSVTAQEKNKSDEFVQKMTEKIDLTTIQKDKIYRYAKEYYSSLKQNLAGKEKNENYFDIKNKFEAEFYKNLRKVLSSSQMEKFAEHYKSSHKQ
ncbi:hypothetical protein [Mesonia aquimarina]|uniref:hypothetical protein n=1 Tax=Mesonia aquimarina TaxID=1504967 RepID=UPI000EF5F038|nr:hypothetical protein [Mesonia aquimarina]